MAKVMMVGVSENDARHLTSIIDSLGHETIIWDSEIHTPGNDVCPGVDLFIVDSTAAVREQSIREKLEKHKPVGDIPVIALTDFDEKNADEESLIAHVVDEFLAKPIRGKEVKARLSSMIRLRELSYQVALSRQFLEEEMDTAWKVQAAMLPSQFPYPDKVSFHTYYESSVSIGGDFYDALDYGEGKIGILMADVSGHGPSAALVVSIIKTLTHTFLAGNLTPTQVADKLNTNLLKMIPEGHFITLFYGVYDVNERTLCYVRCGHPYPYIIREKERSVIKLNAPGGLIGIFDEAQMVESTVTLEPGDKLFTYSDGLVDVCDENKTAYGYSRLENTLREKAGLKGDRLINEILEETWVFDSGKCGADDVAILLMETN